MGLEGHKEGWLVTQFVGKRVLDYIQGRFTMFLRETVQNIVHLCRNFIWVPKMVLEQGIEKYICKRSLTA